MVEPAVTSWLRARDKKRMSLRFRCFKNKFVPSTSKDGSDYGRSSKLAPIVFFFAAKMSLTFDTGGG